MIPWKRKPTSRSDKKLFAESRRQTRGSTEIFPLFYDDWMILFRHWDGEVSIYLGKYWFCFCFCFVSFWQQDLKAACKGEDSPALAQVSVALRDTERARTPLQVEYRLWSDFIYDAWKTNHRCSCRPSPSTNNKYKWLNLPFSLYQRLNSILPNPSLLIQIQNLLIFC